MKECVGGTSVETNKYWEAKNGEVMLDGQKVVHSKVVQSNLQEQDGEGGQEVRNEKGA